MDFFTSKNPDKPIDDVFLTGDGALIKGIDGLFKVQLNVSTRVMDTLYNIKFDPKIDLKIYNPVYLMVPIGAAFDPMGFELGETGSKGGASSVDTTPLVIAFIIIAVIVAGGVTAYSFIAKNKAQSKLDQVNRDIDSIKDIEQIVQDYEDAESVYMDAQNMYSYTENLNENVGTLIAELEDKMPKGISLTAFDSSSTEVSFTGNTKSYEDIAAFAINLKDIECIDNSFVQSVTENVDQQSGDTTYDFTVTCIYKDVNADDTETSTDEVSVN